MTELKRQNSLPLNKKRDYYIDNIKAVFIFLVVLGHLLDYLGEAGLPFAINLRSFIYFFHMPGFIFLSGYLAKSFMGKQFKGEKLISYGWLYLLFKDAIELVHFIYDRNFFAGNNHTKITLITIALLFFAIFLISWLYQRFITFRYGFILFIVVISLLNTNIFVVGGAPWYLLSLIFWYIFIYLTQHMNPKYVMTAAIVMAAVLDYQEEIGKFLSLSRTINFLPFFLLGFYMSKEQFQCITSHKTIKQFLPWTLVLLFVACMTNGKTVRKFFGIYMYGVSSYEKLPDSLYGIGPLLALLWLFLAAILMFALFVLCPRKQTFFSYVGKNTLGIYVLHRLFKDFLYYGEVYDFLPKNQYVAVGIIILISLFMVLLFGSNLCTRAINNLSKFPTEGIYNKKKFLKS